MRTAAIAVDNAVAGRPTLTLVWDSGNPLRGSMTILGETRGVREWATLKLGHATTTADLVHFETELPDNEGIVHWTFRIEDQNRARLTAVPDDANPGDDLIEWMIVRD